MCSRNSITSIFLIRYIFLYSTIQLYSNDMAAQELLNALQNAQEQWATLSKQQEVCMQTS